MQMPQPWPFSEITALRAWRDYLDDAQLANATLRREADAEIARALRCQEGRRQPKRPALVPRERTANGVRS